MKNSIRLIFKALFLVVGVWLISCATRSQTTRNAQFCAVAGSVLLLLHCVIDACDERSKFKPGRAYLPGSPNNQKQFTGPAPAFRTHGNSDSDEN